VNTPFPSLWDTTCPKGGLLQNTASHNGILRNTTCPKGGLLRNTASHNGDLMEHHLPQWAYWIPWGIGAYRAHSMIHNGFHMAPFPPSHSSPLTQHILVCPNMSNNMSNIIIIIIIFSSYLAAFKNMSRNCLKNVGIWKKLDFVKFVKDFKLGFQSLGFF